MGMDDRHLERTAEVLCNQMSGQREQQMKFNDKWKVMYMERVFTVQMMQIKHSLPFQHQKSIMKGKQYSWWNFLLKDVVNAKNKSEFQGRTFTLTGLTVIEYYRIYRNHFLAQKAPIKNIWEAETVSYIPGLFEFILAGDQILDYVDQTRRAVQVVHFQGFVLMEFSMS